MRRRPERDEERPDLEFVVPHDGTNELVVIAAAIADPEARKALLSKVQPDHFVDAKHQAIWHALGQLQRQGLEYDPATLQKVAGNVDVSYLGQLQQLRPDAPANLEWHVDALFWDKQRAAAAEGPVSALLQALKNPAEAPDRVRALARHVGGAFEGGYGARAHLHDPKLLVTQQVDEIRRRLEGHECHPFGIDGLDYYDPTYTPEGDVIGRRRMVPGCDPCHVTVVTGVPGSGKSTLTARLVLALARQGKRVCYGAWEMTGGMTLELLACMSLGWSRTDLMDPAGSGARFGHDELVRLEERMHLITPWVSFFKNPFRRRGERHPSNEKNLDIVQGVLSDSACDVFVADLWKRCLRQITPDDEEEALIRQQAMAEELRIHCILVQQQRMKDVESRPDKRPTREGIKGSGAWVEVPDNILATHRPAQWKRIADNKLEVFVFKQRYGVWPLGIEFDYDGDRGAFEGGRSVDYEQYAEETGGVQDVFVAPRCAGGSRRKKA